MPTGRASPRLLLISIDGLAGFYWTDARARMPHLRRLAARGVVSEWMECVFPSTTWPTHVSLVTGVRPHRHGVAGNHILNRATGQAEDLTGDPVYDAAELLRVPTLYDVAHAAGRRTAGIDWPCTRNSPSLDFSLPFFKDQRVFETQTAPHVWDELAALGCPMGRQGEWALLPRRFMKDKMVADVSCHVLERHAPDVMLVHFLCTDSFQHLHGPRSPEAYWAIEYVDQCVGQVLAALEGTGRMAGTLVSVVSDHGFLPSGREIRLNVRLRQLGLLDVDDAGRIASRRARVVMNHGAAYLYITDEGLAGGGARQRFASEVLAPELRGIEGVGGVWTPGEYEGLGLPSPEANGLAGDLVLEAHPGFAFGDEARGNELWGPPRYLGTHGQRPVHRDNGAFFLLAGRGVREGKMLGPMTSRDVAPTLARLLGLWLPEVEGRVLEEALA